MSTQMRRRFFTLTNRQTFRTSLWMPLLKLTVFLLAAALTYADVTPLDYENLNNVIEKSPNEENRDEGSYLIGTGIHDMTGPAGQINFMGYARMSQTAHGIHMRLRSRAFIMAQPMDLTTQHENLNVKGFADKLTSEKKKDQNSVSMCSTETESYMLRKGRTQIYHDDVHDAKLAAIADPEKTVCFVSIDAGMGSDLLTTRVLTRLEDLLPPIYSHDKAQRPKRLCHRENTVISGTHTHSAPGGFIQYTLYQMTSLGFSDETMDTFVEGIAQSILLAYLRLNWGSIGNADGTLFGANINRSPSSYLLNPKEERDLYDGIDKGGGGGDTDKTMQLLRFTHFGNQTSDEKSKDSFNENIRDVPVGMLNWFAVHGTSMNSTNQLISGDNKGFASYLTEKHFNPTGTLPGKGKFVAAFASTNLGDVSPNTRGPRCIDSGLRCDGSGSCCNGNNQKCIASGPGNDMFESTAIIGRRQHDFALRLFENATINLRGSISFRHAFIDMRNREVVLEDGTIARTCSAALGYAFAAGTTDGPGDFNFRQGTNSSSPFWNLVSGFLSKPTQEQIECHAPKPILLNTGKVTKPYAWDPDSVPISVFKVGQLFIVNVPAEFTTMAGRRLRKIVSTVARDHGIEDPIVTISGLANSYTHYVTTFEEYTGQRYEAASTLYGPHTLTAYLQEFERITRDLLEGKVSQSDQAPPDLYEKQISLMPPVILDTIAFGRKFGSVKTDANDEYMAGIDKVFVSFHSSNPRNNQRIEGTFLTVGFLNDDGSWTTKYVDGDWCTRYEWKSNELLGISFAHITWDIPDEAQEGRYNICHYGTRKSLWGDVSDSVVSLERMFGYTGIGSIALQFAAYIVDFVIRLVGPVRNGIEYVVGSKLTNFQGCSKTFYVHAAPKQ